MRRLCIATIVAMLATAIVAPAGHTLEFPQHPVSGSFTVTSFNLVFFTDPGCEFGILLDWSITGDIAPFGPSTITMHTCQHLTGNNEIDTSFTLPRGRGFPRGNDPSLPRHAASTAGRAQLHFELAIVSGTSHFTGMTGSVVLDAVLFLSPNATPPGTASGTVNGPAVPTDKNDCKRSGWRLVVDANDHPFSNQGRCIAFVHHN